MAQRGDASVARLVSADLPAIAALQETVGWDFTRPDLSLMLKAGTVVGHKLDGRLISHAARFDYGPWCWIGAVMVEPRWQSQGFGGTLMRMLLADIKPEVTVALSTTGAGRFLYERMGFVEIGWVQQWVAERSPTLPAIAGLAPLDTEDEIDAAAVLDRTATGGDRSRFLRARREQAELGVMVTRRDRVTGFGFAVPKRNLRIIGPLVAEDMDLALGVASALADGATRVRIEVPDSQKAFGATLKQSGFVMTSMQALMTRQGRPLPGQRSQMFGFAAKAFG